MVYKLIADLPRRGSLFDSSAFCSVNCRSTRSAVSFCMVIVRTFDICARDRDLLLGVSSLSWWVPGLCTQVGVKYYVYGLLCYASGLDPPPLLWDLAGYF